MSEVCNEVYSKKNERAKENTATQEYKTLTFKDWKTTKNREKKCSSIINIQTKPESANKTCHRDHKRMNAGFSVIAQGVAGFPRRYGNGINNYSLRGNGFVTFGTAFYNSFNNANHGPNNFLNNNYNTTNTLNCQSANGRNMPNSFFTTDGIYRQRDMMQKPLPSQLKKYATTKLYNEKKKKSYGNTQNTTKIDAPSNTNAASSLAEEAKTYVPNPHACKDGKPFALKPKLPGDNIEISKEEKKKQWKEYREAMKPFKNREFYNAKRVVQRLGKRDVKDLDERSLLRLTKAREVMAAHKARLTAKYSDYVKAEGISNELGEVYILKKPILKYWEVEKSKYNQKYINFSDTQRNSIIEPGRKILGGYSTFKGFVPSDMLEDAIQTIEQVPAL